MNDFEEAEYAAKLKKLCDHTARQQRRRRIRLASWVAALLVLAFALAASAQVLFNVVADVRLWAISDQVLVTSFEIEYAPSITYRCFVSNLGGLSCTELAPPLPVPVAPLP